MGYNQEIVLSQTTTNIILVLVRKTIVGILLILTTLIPSVLPVLSAGTASHTQPAVLEQAVQILEDSFSVSVPTVYAQVPGSGTKTTRLAQQFFSGVLQVFVVLNWVALSLVQALLDPDVIFGEKLANGERALEITLRYIWVISRNIVNAIFAFILLAAGFFLIFKADSDAMSKVKSTAPKFVLAVILVNFSWFFPRVILDVSHVLSSVIYELPALTNPGFTCVAPGGESCSYVWKVKFFPTSGECAPSNWPETGRPNQCIRPLNDRENWPWGVQVGDLVDVYMDEWDRVREDGVPVLAEDGDPTVLTGVRPVSGSDVVINGLAVNFAKLPSFALIDFHAIGPGSTAGKSLAETAAAYARFFIHVVLHVALSIAVGLALLAFAAVLIVRMVVIWLCIAFMPFIFLGMAMGRPLGDIGAGEAQAPNIWKKFLSYAFIPALVAVPFAIGFTLINQLYYLESLAIDFHIADDFNVEGLEGFIQGFGSLHQILWLMMTIGIIWVGVFSILEKDQIANKIVGGIKGVGQTGARFATNAVGYAPLIPMPGGRTGSLFDMRDRARQTSYNPYMQLRPPGGEGGGGARTTPTRDEVGDDVARQISQDRQALTDALRNLSTSNSSANVGAELRRLSHAMPALGATGAAMATNNETFNEVINQSVRQRVITDAEARQIRQNVHIQQHFQQQGRVTQLPPISTDNTLDPAALGRSVAQQAADALRNNADIAEIQRVVEDALNRVPGSHRQSVEQVRDALRTGGADLQQTLDRLANPNPNP